MLDLLVIRSERRRQIFTMVNSSERKFYFWDLFRYVESAIAKSYTWQRFRDYCECALSSVHRVCTFCLVRFSSRFSSWSDCKTQTAIREKNNFSHHFDATLLSCRDVSGSDLCYPQWAHRSEESCVLILHCKMQFFGSLTLWNWPQRKRERERERVISA